MTAIRIGLDIALAAVFLVAGLAKLTRQPKLVADFGRMHLSGRVMLAAGTTEVLAGIALFVGLAVPPLAVATAIALAVQMLLAAAAETRGGNPSTVAPPVVLAILAASLGVLTTTT